MDEALLEALYFKPLRDMFDSWSSANGYAFAKILKPSRPEEKFVGFDYGWVVTTVSVREYMSDLIAEIRNPTGKVFDAYFMQYKVGKKSKNVTEVLRNNNLSLPISSCELRTKRNANNEPSQHEVLKSLSSISGASVCYCVPEIFSEDDLPRDPKIDELRIFAVDAVAPAYTDNQTHRIFFKPGSNQAIWASEPVAFESATMRDFLSGRTPLSAQELYDLLGEVRARLVQIGAVAGEGDVQWPSSFRIIEYTASTTRG